MSSISQYLIVLVTGLVLDGVWLGLIAANFYRKQLGSLMKAHPTLWVAGLFYLAFALAIVVFIISPALAQNWTVGKVILSGALLGLVIYGGYDFTNQATLANWPVAITVADLAWGIAMSAMTSGISFAIIQKFLR